MTEKVYGIHAVRALLTRHAERVNAVTLAEQRGDPRIAEIQSLAQNAGKAVKRASPASFKQLFGDAVHQGVYADVQPLAPWHEEELVAGITRALEAGGAKPFVLVLDGVQDPHNLGACLRSAAAAGATAVVIPKDKAVQVNATVRKTSAGAADTLPIFSVTNLSRTLRDLQKAGVWIYGFAGEADASLYALDLKGNVALVMGSEGDGLRRLTRENCDQLVKIPMPGEFESLNVSVATGIALFEAVRQRSGGA